MSAQQELPEPLKCMLEHLAIDLKAGGKLSAEAIRSAISTCVACDMHDTCDYQVESRYFICPNRELLDDLEEQLDEESGRG